MAHRSGHASPRRTVCCSRVDGGEGDPAEEGGGTVMGGVWRAGGLAAETTHQSCQHRCQRQH
eukprot:2431178-Pyramimonas_sp.AAC.1